MAGLGGRERCRIRKTDSLLLKDSSKVAGFPDLPVNLSLEQELEGETIKKPAAQKSAGTKN